MTIKWAAGPIIGTLCFVGAYYYILRAIVRILAFPGSFPPFRHRLEKAFGEMFATKAAKTVLDFKASIEEVRRAPSVDSTEELHQCK